MSFALERQLIETAYRDSMPAASAIQFENAPAIAAPATGFTRLSVLSGGEGRRIDVTAAPSQRVPGVIDVAIFVRPDLGTAEARVIADLVASALAYRTFASGTTTIRTYGARLDLIGRAGVWFQANITIRFERDTR